MPRDELKRSDDAGMASDAAPRLSRALAALGSAREEGRRVVRDDLAFVASALTTLTAEHRPGVIFRLRATVTPDLLELLDGIPGFWQAVAEIPDGTGSPSYRSPDAARADFVGVAQQNKAMLPRSDAQHDAAMHKADRMLAATGLRPYVPVNGSLAPWARVIKRSLGLGRSLARGNRPRPRASHGSPRRASRAGRPRARSPGPREDDPELQQPDGLTPVGVQAASEIARLRGPVAAADALARAADALSFPRAAELVLGAPDDVRAALWGVRL